MSPAMHQRLCPICGATNRGDKRIVVAHGHTNIACNHWWHDFKDDGSVCPSCKSGVRETRLAPPDLSQNVCLHVWHDFRDGSREGDQAPPQKNDLPIIHELVKQDIQARLELGIKRYGTGLQPHNGRDILKDIYDELLDAACYVRTAIYERDGE